jgi:Skp family chaperone for outer membrane proteins
MKLRKFAFAAILCVGLSQTVGAAFAQQKIYIVDEAQIRRDSKIGKDITDKLGAIKTDGVDKLGLKKLSDEIKAEQDRLKPQTASLTKEALAANPTLKAQVEALAKKENEYLQKADYLNQNLDQQQNAAMIAFNAALQPAVNYVGKELGADLVLSASSTWYIKDAVNISAKVVARLDATTPSLASLQQTAQAASAAGKPPAPAPQ